MRIYPDASVFGGCFDSELKVPAGQLFEMFARGDARLVLSDLTRSELAVEGAYRIRRADRHVP